MHFWPKYGNPDFNRWWPMARTDSQAQNWVNIDFEVKFDLEGQGQSPPKTIGILTKVFYTFGPNLAILASTGPELSRGQASDWRTDWHTHWHTHIDAGDDNTRRPKLASGKNYKNEYKKIKSDIIPPFLHYPRSGDKMAKLSLLTHHNLLRSCFKQQKSYHLRSVPNSIITTSGTFCIWHTFMLWSHLAISDPAMLQSSQSYSISDSHQRFPAILSVMRRPCQLRLEAASVVTWKCTPSNQ